MRDLLGLGAGVAAGPLLGALDVADAIAQDGSTRDALTRRFSDGHMETTRVRMRGSPLAWGRCIGMVDARFTEVIAVLLDFEHYERLLGPLITNARVLSRSHGRAQVYVDGEVFGRDALWAELAVRITGREDGTHWIEANMARGDLHALFARWQLVATTGRVRTLVSFRLLARPRVALPDSLMESENVRAAEGALNRLRLECARRRRAGARPRRRAHP
jgi:hypothetical protein